MTLNVGRLRDQSAVRRPVIHDVTFTYVVDGAMAMDPEWFTPAIPLSYWWDDIDELDSSASIPMSTGGLLVERSSHRLLIDAGLGEITVDAGVGRTNTGDFLKTLASLRVDRSSIDVLAFTHLHQDHTGWAFVDDGAGTRAPTFPNATYVLAQSELAVQSHRQEGELAQLDECSIVESLQHQKIPRLIHDGDTIAGDVFHTPAQLGHGAWTSAPDAQPEPVPAARARIIEELRRPNTVGFGFHLR